MLRVGTHEGSVRTERSKHQTGGGQSDDGGHGAGRCSGARRGGSHLRRAHLPLLDASFQCVSFVRALDPPVLSLCLNIVVTI